MWNPCLCNSELDMRFLQICGTNKTLLKVKVFPNVIFRITFPSPLTSNIIKFSMNSFFLFSVDSKEVNNPLSEHTWWVTPKAIHHYLGFDPIKFISKTTAKRFKSSTSSVISLSHFPLYSSSSLIVYNLPLYDPSYQN